MVFMAVYFPLIVIVAASYPESGPVYSFAVVFWVAWLIALWAATIYVIKKKGRSLAWILLMFFFGILVPLILQNKNTGQHQSPQTPSQQPL